VRLDFERDALFSEVPCRVGAGARAFLKCGAVSVPSVSAESLGGNPCSPEHPLAARLGELLRVGAQRVGRDVPKQSGSVNRLGLVFLRSSALPQLEAEGVLDIVGLHQFCDHENHPAALRGPAQQSKVRWISYLLWAPGGFPQIPSLKI